MSASLFSDLQLSAPEFRPLGSGNAGGRPAAQDDPGLSSPIFKFGRSVSCQGLSTLGELKASPPLPFRSRAPSPKLPQTELFLSDQHQRCSMDTEVNAQLNDILRALQPNSAAEAKRTEVLAQVEAVIKKSLGAKVFPHGSFALKTYLPDSNVNLCAFFTHNNYKAWGQRALKLLTRDDSDVPLPIRSAELVAAPDGGKMIRVVVRDITVDVSANASHVLASCALFEEVDRLLDQSHLFKRSIILTKAWAQYDAKVLDATNGLLSSYVIRTMVLFIFNAFHRRITTPFDTLLLLFQYLAKFDWNQHVFGLFGPIHLSSLPLYESVVGEPCSWPSNAKPLISKALLSRYAVDPATANPSDDTFTDWAFNVIDPRNPVQNLGAGLSRMNAAFVKERLTETAKRALSTIAAWDLNRDPHMLFAKLMPSVLARIAMISVPADAGSVFDADLSQMTKRILQAGEFDMPDINERDLVQLMVTILQENESVVTVGKMGSLMHSATNNHALPAMLKARYGGLKKLLRRHEDIFALASDHPHNPHVMLLPTYGRAMGLWTTPDCSPSRTPSPVPPASASLFAPVPQHTIWSSTSQSVPPRPASVPVHSGRNWRDDSASTLWQTGMSTPHWFPSLPEEFFCPISGDIMRDPVVASDGVTYDRASLEILRQSCRTFSPLTGLPLDLTNVYPNLALKSLLAKIRSEELVLTSRPTGTLSRIGHYYERCASIWG